MGRLLGKPYVVLINGHRPASDAIITMDEGRLRFSTARHTARLFVDASRYPMIHKIHFVLTLSDGISCPFNLLTYISKMSHLFFCKKNYHLRISNVGLSSSLNFRIQGHKLKLVEVEGCHTVQNVYDSLDIHISQTYSLLINANQQPQDYYMVASTRFTSSVLTCIATFHYSNS